MELLIALRADRIHHHLPILVAVHRQLSRIQVEVSIPAFQVLQAHRAHRALQAIQVVEIIIIQDTIQMQAEIQAHQIHTIQIQIHTATETEIHTADETHTLETKTRTLVHLSVDFSAVCSVVVVAVAAVVVVAAVAIDTEAADQMDSIMATFSMLYLVAVATAAAAQVCFYY